VPRARDEAKLGVGSLPWPPIVAGLISGALQIPLRIITGDGQGGSSSIEVVVGTLTCGFLSPKYRVRGFGQLWQFCFVWIGTTLGALASAQTSKNVTFPPTGETAWRSFVGGMLCLLGARFAGGCTCGHGVSGFSELSFQSIAATCAIFGGAIISGFIVQAAGGGPHLAA